MPDAGYKMHLDKGMSLTRISHRLSKAAADPGMSAALRSLGLLAVLGGALGRTSLYHARLRRCETLREMRVRFGAPVASPAC